MCQICMFWWDYYFIIPNSVTIILLLEKLSNVVCDFFCAEVRSYEITLKLKQIWCKNIKIFAKSFRRWF
jgi:hypothetical protein